VPISLLRSSPGRPLRGSAAVLVIVGVMLVSMAVAPTSSAVIDGTAAPIDLRAASAQLETQLPDGRRYRSCSASVIAPSWVITAAHCLANPVTGVWYFAESSVVAPLTSVQAVFGAVDSVVVYPGFEGTEPTYDNISRDVALLHLATPAQSVALPLLERSNNTGLGVEATVRIVGWGSTLPYDPQAGGTPTAPSYAVVGSMAVSANTRRIVGLEAGPSRSCFGDSGGPLIVQLADGGVAIAALASVGGMACGIEDGQDARYVRPDTAWVSEVTNGEVEIVGQPMQLAPAPGKMSLIAPVRLATVARKVPGTNFTWQAISVAGRVPSSAAAAVVEVDVAGTGPANVAAVPCPGDVTESPGGVINTAVGGGTNLAVIPLGVAQEFCLAGPDAPNRLSAVRLMGWIGPGGGLGVTDQVRAVVADGSLPRKKQVPINIAPTPGVADLEIEATGSRGTTRVTIGPCGKAAPMVTVSLKGNARSIRNALVPTDRPLCASATASASLRVTMTTRWGAGGSDVTVLPGVQPWLIDELGSFTLFGRQNLGHVIALGKSWNFFVPTSATKAWVRVSSATTGVPSELRVGRCDGPALFPLSPAGSSDRLGWVDLDGSGKLCTQSSGAGSFRVQIVALCVRVE
jgi:hypothetical protein